MAFIDLNCLHLEVRQIALVHEEMQGCYEVTKIGIDADVVVECRFQMQDIVLIALLVDILDWHLRVEELVEIQIALPIVIDSTFS